MASLFRKTLDALATLVPRWSLVNYLRRTTLHWLIPVVLVAASLAAYSVVQVHRQQAAFLLAQAHHVTTELDLDLQRRQHGLKSIVALTSAADPSIDSVRWYGLARAYDLVFGTPVVLANSDRRILFNTRAPLGEPLADLPKPPGHSALMEALLTGEPKVGDVVFAPVLGRKIVTVIVPVMQRHALLGLIILPEMEAVLTKEVLPAGWAVSVFDSVGNLIASSSERPLSYDRKPSARRAVIRSSTTPWTIVIEANRWAFYQPHLEASAILLLCIGLSFAGGSLATRKAGRGLLASLQRSLVRTARPEARTTNDPVEAIPRIDEIEAAGFELKRLSTSRYQIEESARARLAHDLQDGLQQDATAAAMHLQLLKSQLDANSVMHQTAGAASECVRRVMEGMAEVIQDLRPASATEGGLSRALQTATERFSASTGIHAEFDVRGEDALVDALPGSVIDCLYRVAQACLRDIHQHGDASLVHIDLDLRNPVLVCLTVMDDGGGPGAENVRRSTASAVQTMADRVAALHGTIEARQGHDLSAVRGTTVVTILPVLQAKRR